MVNILDSAQAGVVPLAVTITEGIGGGTWSGLLFYVGMALAISFLCSILEAVLLSTSA